MSEYSDLIDKLEDIRYYMREYHIYGFKTCQDFKEESTKCPKIYDNTYRRIKSWLGDLVKAENIGRIKKSYISMDSSKEYTNPLYKAYQYKTFTHANVQLHFCILDILQNDSKLTIKEIYNRLYNHYGLYFGCSEQNVRVYLNKYVELGILTKEKIKNKDTFSIAEPLEFIKNKEFENAMKFHSMSSPLSVIGYFLLNQMGVQNDTFLFKHNYIANTLDDIILIEILQAIQENKKIEMTYYNRNRDITKYVGIPLKILSSTRNGRRYLILYREKRFKPHRLDNIIAVKILDYVPNYNEYSIMLERNLTKCWGVSFGDDRNDYITFNIAIDLPKEQYILNRLKRECRNGTIEEISQGIYSCTIHTFDVLETKTWIRSFIGRITHLESSKPSVVSELYEDIRKMYKLYCD